MAESCVSTLVNRGLIAPKPQDALWDVVHYSITPAGRQAISALLGEPAGRAA